MVVDFWEPLLADVLKGGGGGDGEADEEDVGLGVGEGTESVVIFLSCGIEEAKRIGLVTDPRGVREGECELADAEEAYITVTA